MYWTARLLGIFLIRVTFHDVYACSARTVCIKQCFCFLHCVCTIVREYVFYVFFLKIQKYATFYVFLKRHFKKNVKKRNPKFEVSDFADFTTWNLHYSSKTMYVYNICGLSSCVKGNKFDCVWYLGLEI